ncbi:MAG: DUF6498-containing protein [Pseudomonadota bacterium]
MALRGLSAVREGWSRPSGKILVAVNLGLLAGVLLFDWSVFDIIFLFWAENLVIGAINVLKMITAHPAPSAAPDPESGTSVGQASPVDIKSVAAGWGAKLFLIPFFILHYGGFCLGHGIFVFALFNEAGEFGDDLWTAVPALLTGALGLSLAMLAASHFISFLLNYLGRGEYRRTSASELMGRPYGRIIALHVTIIVGGFLALAADNHVLMLTVLVVLKTFVDLAMHGRERQKYVDPESAPIMS